jgi:hypothetical protein
MVLLLEFKISGFVGSVYAARRVTSGAEICQSNFWLVELFDAFNW